MMRKKAISKKAKKKRIPVSSDSDDDYKIKKKGTKRLKEKLDYIKLNNRSSPQVFSIFNTNNIAFNNYINKSLRKCIN